MKSDDVTISKKQLRLYLYYFVVLDALVDNGIEKTRLYKETIQDLMADTDSNDESTAINKLVDKMMA
jgi:hypothetical protein